MAVRYLLDTNIASYAIKGNFPAVRRHLLKVAMSDVGISVVTEAELRFGAARLPGAVKLASAVEELILRVEVLPWDSRAARRYAQLRAALEEHGQPMGNLDLMIAAHALANQVILVTNDRVFRRVEGLELADWTKP